MTYEEQLKDPRWIAKREEILTRDWRLCQKCLSGKNLHVHHKRYIAGRMAWEYAGIDLITLCEDCHGTTHRFDVIEGQNEDPMIRSGKIIRSAVDGIIGLMANNPEKNG